MITYADKVTLVKVGVNKYGKEVRETEAEVYAIFEQNTAWRHGLNETLISSDSIVFVDPGDEFVQANFNRLEGMLLIADLFGAGDKNVWYRVINVVVSRDTQLTGEIDNIQLALKKTVGL